VSLVQVHYGRRGSAPFSLETSADLVAVRTHDQRPVAEASLSGKARRLLDTLEPVTAFIDAGVEVFHVRSGAKKDRDAVRTAFTAERSIRFAGRVLADPVFRPQRGVRATMPAAATRKQPVLYSENLFVQFDGLAGSKARRVLAERGLAVKREVDYLRNAYFVGAKEGTGLKVFDLALELLRNVDGVEFAHPEVLRPRQFRGEFPQQWHLKPAHGNVVAAWELSRGQGVTIAVIDVGIDIDHEEFGSRGKIVSPRDTHNRSRKRRDPRPRFAEEMHGTACAGIACANGKKGASGVAPAARLMPIRLIAGLGSQAEADAIAWAAQHGADVISCSWGPADGDWKKPKDPKHREVYPLPPATRLAIEYALEKGRGGKGCVICWAAGNGNEPVDNDHYAAHPGVVTVAACNVDGKRNGNSDKGKALWCAFPSGDKTAKKLTGLWTTDWSGGRGYNSAGKAGDAAGNYCNTFAGTSGAAPGVAGVAALVLALNKKLRGVQVKDILRHACDRIDPRRGRYDRATGHSPLYGFGRLNALQAVKLARKTR